MFDAERHSRLLRGFIRDATGRIVPACARRIAEEFPDGEDKLEEANGRLLDAMNFLAMDAAEARNGALDDPLYRRYFRHLQSAHVLLREIREKKGR